MGIKESSYMKYFMLLVSGMNSREVIEGIILKFFGKTLDKVCHR